METAIRVNNVHKKFKVYFDKGTSLKEKVLFSSRRRYEIRTVLDGINFEVKKGEAIGIIGENGSGKSTMLKLLSRIMYPDKGSIDINGRVSALIELGAGFHPDLTGRENIYTNAAIFGLTKKEIDARLQTIIDFSELGEYIDNPVRTYSTGMYMRLAFSIAINVDADILLIDEILAVGDANFQMKCFNKLRKIKAQGTTIVIVSHSLGQIEQICEKSIWIHDGKIKMEGLPRDVHPYYMDYMGEKNNILSNVTEEDNKYDNEEEVNRWGDGSAKIQFVKLTDKAGTEKSTFKTGEPMQILIGYKTFKALEKPVIGIGIFRNDELQCYGTNTYIDQIKEVELKDSGIVTCLIETNYLLRGEYSLDVAIHAENGYAYDYYKKAAMFQVYTNLEEAGVVRLPHIWKFN